MKIPHFDHPSFLLTIAGFQPAIARTPLDLYLPAAECKSESRKHLKCGFQSKPAIKSLSSNPKKKPDFSGFKFDVDWSSWIILSLVWWIVSWDYWKTMVSRWRFVLSLGIQTLIQTGSSWPSWTVMDPDVQYHIDFMLILSLWIFYPYVPRMFFFPSFDAYNLE